MPAAVVGQPYSACGNGCARCNWSSQPSTGFTVMAIELIPAVNIALIEKIDALLPQTQCTKCGYDGCKPYATAIANGDAINKCPPGGAAGIAKLARLLQQPEIPLDTTHGEEPKQLL